MFFTSKSVSLIYFACWFSVLSWLRNYSLKMLKFWIRWRNWSLNWVQVCFVLRV